MLAASEGFCPVISNSYNGIDVYVSETLVCYSINLSINRGEFVQRLPTRRGRRRL